MPPTRPELRWNRFVHLRKGNTPRRLHADLDGLKDDELGRGGFTAPTRNKYRRNAPKAYPRCGPRPPGDARAIELTPNEATAPAGGPASMLPNTDSPVFLTPRA